MVPAPPEKPRQAPRLAIVAAYAGLALFAQRLGFGTWLPEADGSSLWLLTAAGALVFGDLLITPFFTSPVNALSYSATLLAAFALPAPTASGTAPKAVALIALGIVAGASALAILLKDSEVPARRDLSNALRLVVDQFGSARLLFAGSVAYCALGYHARSAREIGSVLLFTAVYLASPIERALAVQRRLSRRQNSAISESVGAYIGSQEPGLVLVKQTSGDLLGLGDCLVTNIPNVGLRSLVILDQVGTADGSVFRCHVLPDPLLEMVKERERDELVIPGAVHRRAPDEIEAIEERLGGPLQHVLGLVAPGSSVRKLEFDVLPSAAILSGDLVETRVRGKRVLYQVVDARTLEESVQARSRYGFHRASAATVGSWSASDRAFEKVAWLPDPNAPVTLPSDIKDDPGRDVVGTFPRSPYPVRISDLDALVTHNTAILGILGIGKSTLTFELVERLVDAGIKVVAVDPTGEYSIALSDLAPPEVSQRGDEKIQRELAAGKGAVDENPEAGGTMAVFRRAIGADIDAFLASERPLRIFNPTLFDVQKQVREPSNVKVGPGQNDWKRLAGLHSVFPSEITRIIAEELLRKCATDLRKRAYACLVLEEAHSLAPEWNSAADEDDQKAAQGTAKAILQGRKFGMGCIVVSQRTANVTKTILNQCNTVFAMRSFDDTGRQFLQNYLGTEYVSLLPGLEERQAVFFGKASSSADPVLVRLNDREVFLRRFRGPKEEGMGEVADEQKTAEGPAEVDADEAGFGSL